MRFWHQLVELLRFRDHQNCGEANVWHVLCRISDPSQAACFHQGLLYLAWCSRRLRPLMRRITSPIATGLTPGHLSRATSRQPLYAIKSSGGIMDVASLLANLATSLHRFVEFCPKAESSLRQSSASRPEGPALPWVHCMLSDKPSTDFVENSGVVGKRAWMLALNAVGLQGWPFRMFVV